MKIPPVPDMYDGHKEAWRRGYRAGLRGVSLRENPYRLTGKRDVWGYSRSRAHYAWRAGQREGKKAARAQKVKP